MNNKRNTLLFVAGVGQVITSIVSAISLVLVSLFVEVIDVSLRIRLYNSKLYAFSPQLGERLLTLVFILIFIVLSLLMFTSFASGLIYLNASKENKNVFNNKALIVASAIVNILFVIPAMYGVLAIIAQVIDKKCVNNDNNTLDEDTKNKINQLKQLKNEGHIDQKEFIDMLTKILVE